MATIPTDQAAGTTYRVRVTASNPAVIGSPSATVLTVKTKPAPPITPAVQLTCQRKTANDAFAPLSLTITQDAVGNLYDKNNMLVQSGTLSTSIDRTNAYFDIPKYVDYTDNGFIYIQSVKLPTMSLRRSTAVKAIKRQHYSELYIAQTQDQHRSTDTQIFRVN